ncbi:metallophosphoesterase [Desulfovibrio gilichinskyi]|uniref:Tat (Twin-arginine translocation) pathway signal sequence n=1 Tax=Desulfovibrio gilichinskyi TaxID=1519643 RepID=A0A1X7CTG2_9BACT|nr:metallophosphoesterase [Desulfovibrio gilichinskyi]SMF02778.1 Tat (twin-arginine translocation) pathway signal sequence [Desulfovibrio gilichinskyi]
MKSFTDIYNAGKNTESKEVSRRDFMKFSATTAAVLGLAPACLLTSCYQTDEGPDPFNNGTDERNLIVVISDLHMGADLTYAEINTNLVPLKHFLERIETSSNVKELVVNGDLLDEWFVPATVDTYEGYNQFDFVERIAAANKDVIAVFNRIIFAGKITVTYVPGNHDLTITAANVENILPGIVQARDAGLLGLGTYSPTGCPQVAIEHGHRYNFFCAPDSISNQVAAPGTIMPPGYFFTRIAALHVVQKCTNGADVVPTVTDPLTTVSQNLLYKYWQQWKWALGVFSIKNLFSDSIIVTNVNGFTATYSVNDLLPSQPGGVGPISVNLYNGIQDNWAARCVLNNVPVPLDAGNAIDKSASAAETDRMSSVQYFMNAGSDKRIVVFGHSHVPTLFSSKNYKDEKTIYVNSGTWIDHNPNRTTTNFVVITPQSSEESSQTSVVLYNFENEYVTEMARESVRV